MFSVHQFGNEVVKRLPGDFTHVLVVDGDEFWHPVELQVRPRPIIAINPTLRLLLLWYADLLPSHV